MRQLVAFVGWRSWQHVMRSSRTSHGGKVVADHGCDQSCDQEGCDVISAVVSEGLGLGKGDVLKLMCCCVAMLCLK